MSNAKSPSMPARADVFRYFYILFVAALSLALFVAIALGPLWYLMAIWDTASYSERETAGTLIGWMSFIWFPVTTLIGATLSGTAARLLWPRKRTTLMDIALRNAGR